MKTSAFGIKAIARREGTVLHVYLDSKGLPTAGVGHLITASEKAEFPVGKPITQSQSDRWLAADLKESEDAVNGAVKTPLAQNQFDALVSLTFNIGPGAFERSTVVRKLNAGDTAGAADAILLWNKPPEIRGRRRTEYNQFLTPYKNSAVAPSANSALGPQSTANEQGGPASPQPPNILPPVEVKQQSPSAWVKIGAGLTFLTGSGLQVGALVQEKVSALTPTQILYLIAALGLCALAVWWYRKEAKGAQNRTLALIDKAADPCSHTVELTK